ncbi:hypothetical protein ABZZ80_15475, partial [Streptomyces sp. NPDC006356]
KAGALSASLFTRPNGVSLLDPCSLERLLAVQDLVAACRRYLGPNGVALTVKVLHALVSVIWRSLCRSGSEQGNARCGNGSSSECGQLPHM